MEKRDAELEPIAPPGWPEHIIELAGTWQLEADKDRKERLFTDLWVLTQAAVAKYLRIHAGRNRRLQPEDLRDMAAQKALDLLRSFVGGKWDPTESSPAQLCSFVSTLARNGIVDYMRTHGSRHWEELGPAHEATPGLGKVRNLWAESPADTEADRMEFARALRDCAANLKQKARRIWFFRVFYEMPTKTIAAHPQVQMKPGAVDMTLARCRERIVECMQKKGFETHSIPPGSFTTLWEVFRKSDGEIHE